MRLSVVACALPFLLASPALAQAPDWANATPVKIELASFKFVPKVITLHHGQAYVLRFVNTASGGHDFVAKAFFAAAQYAPKNDSLVKHGEVELDGGQTIEVRLVAPAPGTYEVRCSHFMHAAMGMTGSIVVQ